jgi:hypothetical protein
MQTGSRRVDPFLICKPMPSRCPSAAQPCHNPFRRNKKGRLGEGAGLPMAAKWFGVSRRRVTRTPAIPAPAAAGRSPPCPGDPGPTISLFPAAPIFGGVPRALHRTLAALAGQGVTANRRPRANPRSRLGLWPPCNAAGTPPDLRVPYYRLRRFLVDAGAWRSRSGVPILDGHNRGPVLQPAHIYLLGALRFLVVLVNHPRHTLSVPARRAPSVKWSVIILSRPTSSLKVSVGNFRASCRGDQFYSASGPGIWKNRRVPCRGDQLLSVARLSQVLHNCRLFAAVGAG